IARTGGIRSRSGAGLERQIRRERICTHEHSECGPGGAEGTTAWMQEVEQRMEQLPRTPGVKG
ncbi:MAG: hypothetical protein ABFS45_18310, partial [Pseudomonadota bacterium]